MTCTVCGDPLDAEGGCSICDLARARGFSIEEARLEVEDTARFWTARLSSAEGKPCTCGAGSGAVWWREGPRRGPGARAASVMHFDVEHVHPCPRAPTPFDWPEVDEEARRIHFGYEGRAYHVGRLVAGLRERLAWEERWAA